ncbi:MAG TPA: hypothetical protein VE783_05945 [Candidatus Limnocylindrales bacterium]|nr:hypothetical protein [Candidatus Limnocylindrales bacterium]
MAASQMTADFQQFLNQGLGLTQAQIADIESGKPVAKEMAARTPDEVLLIGVVFIRATPESYLRFATDLERKRTQPGTLGFGIFSDPPQLAELRGFAFDDADLDSLKDCRPGACSVQMPASYIRGLQQGIDWSSSEVGARVNAGLQQGVLDLLRAYKQDGNKAFGTYDDKHHSTDVARQFAYLLSYSRALPTTLPEFYTYLLEYPNSKPANVDDTFYWEHVKFGLKPTLRVVHMMVWHGQESAPVAYAVAQKQLYASHYFETALDLSFCVRSADPRQTGSYLIMALGSEQRGLSGFKGSIVRNAAVGRSVSSLQRGLLYAKSRLESAGNTSALRQSSGKDNKQ